MHFMDLRLDITVLTSQVKSCFIRSHSHSLAEKICRPINTTYSGTQASEGCIRLSMGDAYWLFNTVPIGTTVVVYDSPNPGPLGKPKGIKIPLSQSYDPTDPLYFNTGK